MSSAPILPPQGQSRTTLSRVLASKADNSTSANLTFALCEMAIAAPGYRDAEQYYDGTRKEAFAHHHIARALRGTRDKYKLNFAKTPVNVVADRLVISSVTVDDAESIDDDDTETDEENKTTNKDSDLTKLFNRRVWRPNKMVKFSNKIHRKVSEYGDAYVFVWPETELTPNEDPEDLAQTYVATDRAKVYYNSPKTTRMIYDPEEPDTPLFVIKRWKSIEGRYCANLYFTDRIQHFALSEQVNKRENDRNDRSVLKESDDPTLKGENWELIGETENPYNRLTIFHFRNEDPYGKPEHYDGYGPADAINKISTTMVHTTEWQGFPQRYGLADPNAMIGGAGGPNQSWNDETEATEPDGTDDDGMESGPGTMIKLEGMKEVGTFQSADAKSFLEPAEFYIRSLAQTTTTPLRYFYPPGAHPPSGESYRAEDTPLINKVKNRQDLYEDPWRDLYAFCMEIATGRPAEEFVVDVRWAPAASIDDALGWETVDKKIKAGVPRRQALMEAGYTAEQVDSWLKNNDDKAEFQRDVETLSLLAAAAKNSADTAASGGMNPEAVGQVLTHFYQKFAPKGITLAQPEPHEHPDPAAPNSNDPNADSSVASGFVKPPVLDIPPGGIRERRTAAPPR